MITDYWSLLNISSKQIEWVLNKATPDIVLSKQSITLDSDNLTDTFSITTNSDGNLSIISSDNSIVTVSLSGNTATVTALTDGSTTITVSVTESSNYIIGTKTLSVNVQLFSGKLDNISWETIKEKAQSGEASSLWSVGDSKEVILNGNTTKAYSGTKSYTNYSCYATIIGFDHNTSLETNGQHSIHFILGKDSTGKDICFYPYNINDSLVTTNGWNGSKMKQTTMVEFKNCLPTDLKAVLKSVTKYTHNYEGGANNGYGGYVTATTEQLFLLSEFEVFGSRTYANLNEQNKQEQYVYYKNGNSKARYKDTDGKYLYWWLRSVAITGISPDYWCFACETAPSYGGTVSSYCVAPAFVV